MVIVLWSLCADANAGRPPLSPQIQAHGGISGVKGPGNLGVSAGVESRMTRYVNVDIGGFYTFNANPDLFIDGGDPAPEGAKLQSSARICPPNVDAQGIGGTAAARPECRRDPFLESRRQHAPREALPGLFSAEYRGSRRHSEQLDPRSIRQHRTVIACARGPEYREGEGSEQGGCQNDPPHTLRQ